MTNSQPDRLDRIEAALEQTQLQSERNRQDIEILLQGQTRLQQVQLESAQTQAQLGRTQELLAEVLADVRTNLSELRAGQERQERILDYLIRRDGGEQL